MDFIYCIILFLCFIKINRSQDIAFFRCNNDTKTLQFVFYGQPDKFYDFYAENKGSTCGYRSGAFVGTGSFSDAFILTINLSQGLQAQSPDCGVTQSSDNTVSLVVVAQSSCAGPSSTDQRYVSSCRMVIPSPAPNVIKGNASYACIAPSTIQLTYFRPAPEQIPPADVYAIGNKTTCSKSIGTGYGQGLESSPYVMRIDASTSGTSCGVLNTGPSVYSVVVYVQQYPTVLTSEDSAYTLTCNFTAASMVIIGSQILSATVSPPPVSPPQRTTAASLSVVSGSSSSGLRTIVVGEQIRLVAQLLDSPAVGLRIISCNASPGPGLLPVIQVLNSSG
ncbi:uncharacterized protein LOC131956880 [Physella acuta]|uniref:uncharacterized protein LOC131956880 n=1 Tax=Physella acuta TaxID=109671 RepID=UPI0027DACA8F|nr:uncharacterized protein LOC131956880 [Physella acuta]